MKNKILRRMSFTTLFVICSILGIILGAGIAYAGNVVHNLSVGDYYYYGTHDEDLWSGESYYYDMYRVVNMSSDKSDVTIHSSVPNYYATYYYNGDSNDPSNIYFGPYWIWDEYGYHSVYYDDFLLNTIDGFSGGRDTYWFYGSMDATNNHVVAEQYIWKWSNGDYTSLGSDYTVFITQGS